MGVLNVTPDSFSDGGQHFDVQAALARAREMVGDGARIVDVGGESTRPGAEPVSEQQELDRVIPVIERLAAEVDCILSIDTMKPAVMNAACEAGAQIINDVSALRAPGALEVARRQGAAICLMHMQGEPRTMQRAPHYQDVVSEVFGWLENRAGACAEAGIEPQSILIDPGFGFGKTLDHNLELLAHLDQLTTGTWPVLVGLSRKSLFKSLLGLDVNQRVNASVAAASLAVSGGAAIVRAHDVRPTVEAIAVAAAVRKKRGVGH